MFLSGGARELGDSSPRNMASLDGPESLVWKEWQCCYDGVAWTHETSDNDDGHDTGLPHQLALGITRQGSCHESWLKTIELRARIAEACHLNDRFGTELKSAASREVEQPDAAGRNVFTHDTRCDRKARRDELAVQL